MNIVFCAGSMGKGGAERVIANLSNIFSVENEVSIITTIVGKIEYDLNEKIKYYSLDNSTEKGNFIKRNIQRVKKLNKLIKEINPDIIISFLPEPTYRVMLVNYFRKKKTIISVRNDPQKEYNSFFKKNLVKLLYSKADGFVFQTDDAKNFFNKKIRERSVVIPNPIKNEFICERYSGAREKTVVTVGRLSSQKNHKLLLRGFQKFVSKNNEYVLKIYGDGELKEKLIDYAKSLNISSNVIFMGNKDNIKNEIYKSAAFVLSSDYEGMPNALMEAMALGIPCISTDCPSGGPRFLFNGEKNGILFDVNSEEGLYEALEKIIENPEIADEISKNGNAFSKNFTNEKIAQSWIEYINKII